MGKELGKMHRQTHTSKVRLSFVVLAFFTVVASSPNLSTFEFGCKGSANRGKYQRKNSFSLYFRDAAYFRRSQSYEQVKEIPKLFEFFRGETGILKQRRSFDETTV